MSTTTSPSSMAFADVKEHHIYEVTKKFETSYGYGLEPGLHWIDTLRPESLYTVNMETGRRCTVFPCPKTIPLRPVRNAGAVKAKLQTIMTKAPGSFASFGANMNIGTDPEMFAVDKDGFLLPAFSYLGTKAASVETGMLATGYHQRAYLTPYWDGFQAEWNVTPFSCIAHLHDAIQGGMRALHRLLPAGAKLTAQPVMPVPAHYLESASKEQVDLGCMPSLNAYADGGLAPGSGRHLPIRFAGYHIHFSLLARERTRVEQIVKMMDNLCGVMSVCVLQGLEDPIRRRYYGLAGEYRTPEHGLEWRVLSSAALWHPAVSHLHFNMARCALNLALAGLDTLWEGCETETRECINQLDVGLAQRILERNRALVLGCLKDTYYYDSLCGAGDVEKVLDRMILPGMAQHIELDIAKNWRLTETWAGHSNSHNCDFGKFSAHCAPKKAKA